MMGCRNLFCFLFVIHVVWSISCLKENWMEGGKRRPLTNASQVPTGDTTCCIKMNYLIKNKKMITIELGPKADLMQETNEAKRSYCLVGRSNMRCYCYTDSCNTITNLQTFIDMETKEPFGEIVKQDGHSIYLPKNDRIRSVIMKKVQLMIKSALNQTVLHANQSKTIPCGKGHMITRHTIETIRDITNSSALEGEICAFDLALGPSCSVEDGEMDIAPEVPDIEPNIPSFCFIGSTHISCRCRTPYCNMKVANLIEHLEIEYNNSVASPDFLDEEGSERYLNPVTSRKEWRHVIECVRQKLFHIKKPINVNETLLQELPMMAETGLLYESEPLGFWEDRIPNDDEAEEDSHPSVHINLFLYLLATLIFMFF